MGTPSKWERHNIKWGRPCNFRKRWGSVGWNYCFYFSSVSPRNISIRTLKHFMTWQFIGSPSVSGVKSTWNRTTDSPRANRCEIKGGSKWTLSETKWNSHEIDAASKWGRSGIAGRSKWDRSEIEGKSKWNRSDFEERSRWNRNDMVGRLKMSRSEFDEIRSVVKCPGNTIEIDSKRTQRNTEMRSKWNRHEIQIGRDYRNAQGITRFPRLSRGRKGFLGSQRIPELHWNAGIGSLGVPWKPGIESQESQRFPRFFLEPWVWNPRRPLEPDAVC